MRILLEGKKPDDLAESHLRELPQSP